MDHTPQGKVCDRRGGRTKWNKNFPFQSPFSLFFKKSWLASFANSECSNSTASALRHKWNIAGHSNYNSPKSTKISYIEPTLKRLEWHNSQYHNYLSNQWATIIMRSKLAKRKKSSWLKEPRNPSKEGKWCNILPKSPIPPTTWARVRPEWATRNPKIKWLNRRIIRTPN